MLVAFRAQFLALNLNKVMLNAANIYQLLFILTKYNMYTGIFKPALLSDIFTPLHPFSDHLHFYFHVVNWRKKNIVMQ